MKERMLKAVEEKTNQDKDIMMKSKKIIDQVSERKRHQQGSRTTKNKDKDDIKPMPRLKESKEQLLNLKEEKKPQITF